MLLNVKAASFNSWVSLCIFIKAAENYLYNYDFD